MPGIAFRLLVKVTLSFNPSVGHISIVALPADVTELASQVKGGGQAFLVTVINAVLLECVKHPVAVVAVLVWPICGDNVPSKWIP